MPASPDTLVRRSALAVVLVAALVTDASPAYSAQIIGTPHNSSSAAVQIQSCSVTIDPENANAFPEVELSEVPNTPIKPVSTQVELGLHDALGGADDTHVITVPVEKSSVPLASYPVNGNYVGLACHLRSITFADGSVVGIGYQGTGGSGAGGATLGVLGGLALIGGIAAAAGHGGGSNNNSAPPTPKPTATPIAITPSATPSPTPSPTPKPTPTPTASPSPTPSPVPTPTPTATAGALVITPQSLTFIATGSGYAKTAQASEAHYAGTFAASPATCQDSNGTGNGGQVSTVASISPASTTSGLFTVTPLGPGTCTFQITDNKGDQQILSVGVTTTSGVVQIHKPAPPGPAGPRPGPAPKH